MSKLLMGVQKGENCLLESPTGTGKTLALLSAALAWQRQQRELSVGTESDCQVNEADDLITDVGPHEPLQPFDDFRYVAAKREAPIELAYEDSIGPNIDNAPAKYSRRAGFYDNDDDDDDDVFESPKKKRQRNPKPRAHSPQGNDNCRTYTNDLDGEAGFTTAASAASPVVPGLVEVERDPSQELHSPETTAPRVKTDEQGKSAQRTRKRAPRVYFCSRTHSQLNQVVAELRTCRTAFHDTSAVGIGDDGKPFSMALLASRKSTCINKEGEVPFRGPYRRRPTCFRRVCWLWLVCIRPFVTPPS